MSMHELLQQDRRLVMLRVLNESPAYTANESILDVSLEAYGHRIARDLVLTEMTWLQEQGLITCKEMPNTLIATLT